MMANTIRDRTIHADGVRYPAGWATGTCTFGHDITIEANLSIEARGEYGLYGARCTQCRRDKHREDHQAALLQHRWAGATKTCVICEQPFGPSQRDIRSSRSAFEKRRYCSINCSTRGAKRGPTTHNPHADIPLPPAGWQARAACYDVDVNEFYPEARRAIREAAEQAAIRTYCDRCPVRRACLDTALAMQDYNGVKGGMPGKQRRDYRPPVEAA